MTDILKEKSSDDVLLTGFRDLDNILGGLHNSDLILLASRPEMGKTTLALEIAEYAASHENKKVLFFGLYMSKELLLHRLYNMEAGTDSLKEDSENLIIDDSLHMTLSEFQKKCCEYQAGLVVVDYLQSLYLDNFSYAHEFIGPNETGYYENFLICQKIKQIAEELQIPIILNAYLSRFDIYRHPDAKRPNLMYLQKTFQANQIADVVIFLYRDELYNEDSPYKGITEVTIAKQKNGPLGTVFLSWDPQHTKLVDLSDKQKEEVKKCQQIEKQDILGGDVKDEPYDGLEQTGRYHSKRNKVTGIRTGFHSFDELTTGLNGSDLVLFTGCDEYLNTSLASKIALNSNGGEIHVVYFTLQSDKHVNINYEIVNLKDLKISDISRFCRKFFSVNKGLVIINSLQDISADKEYENSHQNQKIYDNMKSLKQLAVELDIPILVFSKLYRFEKYSYGIKPKLSDIQGIYEIDQIPDVIAFIYDSRTYTLDFGTQKASEIIVEKQPYGPLGTAKFAYDEHSGKIIELD